MPELVDTALATLQDVLDKADVVLQVVDARDVLGGRSGYVEKMVVDAGGVFGLIVNKIGTCITYCSTPAALPLFVYPYCSTPIGLPYWTNH